jgi:tetratricopeptide (TPR) repeat protein
MNGTSPVVSEVNAPGGKVVVAGSIAMLILNNGQTESRLFAGVPPLPKAFVGGDERVAELRGRIMGGGVLALEGTGGVGKTALATALAWDADVLAHFSGGVLWASLGPSPNADELLNRWAEALGIDVTQERTTEQRAAHIQSRLGERKFLFVLDDAWQETPADLLCRIAAPGCAHLLTTRDHTIAAHLASEKPQPVKELPESHAITLLATLCPIAAQADEEALRRLARAAGGLPLALTLIGGYLADNITFRAEVPQVFQGLEKTEAWLGLEDRERRLTLAQIVDLSIAALPDDVRQVFTRLAPFAAKPASFSLEAAQAVSGGDLAALGTLVRRNLLEKSTEERVAMHAVVAACAQRHARRDGALADRHALYYLDWADQNPSDWLRIEAEWAQIQQGWRWVVRNQDQGILAYTEVLRRFLRLRGLWRDALSWNEEALAAARRLDQRGTEAMLLNNIGTIYDRLGERQRALEFFEQALPILREVGDRAGEAVTLNNIGAVYDKLGEQQRALEFYEQALPICREAGDREGEAATLNNIGAVYDKLGERQRAVEFYEQALPIFREIGDRADEAATLNNIGAVYDKLGERQRALEFYEQALPICREVGDRAGEAATQLLEQTVAIDEANAHPDLESDRAVLDALRQKLHDSKP